MSALKRILKQSREALDYVVDLEFNRRFPEWPGSYRGVFASFDEARASAPPTRPVGYDHPELANMYDSRINKAFPSDYPVLYWLLRLTPETSSIFDWGGHIGVSYYAYARYLNLPESFRWCVGDVPTIIEAGRRFAESRGASALSFTSEISDADGHDAFLANGVLQYVEEPLADSLRRLARRPRHLLVNKLPAYDGESFVTLENTLHAFNPYRVFNRRAFLDSLAALDYELIDSWETPDVILNLPLHRERSISAYSGFCFRAKETR